MAKKKTAKERRNEMNALKQKEIQEKMKRQEQQKKEIEEKEEKQKKAVDYQREIEKIEKEDEKMNRIIKSKAKAAGVKSTFVLKDDRLLMTSFGKGNDALLDKYINGDKVSNASPEARLEVSLREKGFAVSGKIEALVDNPLLSKKSVGQDLICCREKLEKLYFGKIFDDNIHIQLIYSILDIEKVLVVHINNIVFSLNNILRRPEEEYDDFIGYMGREKTYEKFCKNEMKKNKSGDLYKMYQELINSPQMAYFGKTLLPLDKKGKLIKKKDDLKTWECYAKKCYYLFLVLGMVRQMTAHGSESDRTAIYKLGAEFDELKKESSKKECREEARNTLDKLYQDRVKKLNDEFLEMSKKDLTIFFEVYNVKTREEKIDIVQKYYQFVVLKTFKNMGFSVKHLRETIIWQNEYRLNLKDSKYDSVRKKLYRAVDFAIYLFYQKEETCKRGEEFVKKLRVSLKESEKEMLYREEAKFLWENLGDLIEKNILPKMNGNYIKDLNAEVVSPEMLNGILVEEKAEYFSEIIYLLTIFLDGKEINDLLTQLINRFENINSFLEVMKKEKIDATFTEDYKIFENSKKIAKELRIINSFARMSEPDPSAKKIMFIEAAQTLGYSENECELESYIDNMLKPKLDSSKKNKNGFRNFIINNVIQSTRFKYLVRYGNPKKVRRLASNHQVVSFVLKEIPNDQIKFYYNSCKSKKEEFFPEMRKELTEIIVELSFKDFENVYQDKTKDIEKIQDKERKKNIIRLYLTVLYLLLKNLIYVNSRYFLAFHCAERDALIYDKNKYEDSLKEDRAMFARDFVEEHFTNNKKAKIYIQTNFENSDRWSLNAYRNCVEHLNAIRNMDQYIDDIRKFESYYELYHYIVQRCLDEQFDHDCKQPSKKFQGENVMSRDSAEGQLIHYFKLVKRYGTYCKDFVKALNVPFAYNLPRYKNLSVNELFDRNHYLPNKGKSKGDELVTGEKEYDE